MRKINLKNIVWKEKNQYVSWNINTGISSFGKTKKEAVAMLQEALELYFEDVSVSEVNEVEKPNLVPLTFEYA